VIVENCPFCHSYGEDLAIEYVYKAWGSTGHYVRCYSCNARGPLEKTEGEALKKWNYPARKAS